MPFFRRRFKRKRFGRFRPRFRRRRFPFRRRFRRGRRRFKRNVIRALGNRPKPEIKVMEEDVNITQDVADQGNTWSVFGGPNCAQGVDSDERIGGKIRIHKIQLWGNLQLSTPQGSFFPLPSIFCRIIIYKTKKASNITSPTDGFEGVETLFGTLNGTIPRINEPYRPRNSVLRNDPAIHPVRVMRDRIYHMASTEISGNTTTGEQILQGPHGRPIILPKWTFKFKKPMIWSYPISTDPQRHTNNVWLAFTTWSPYTYQSGEADCSISASMRVWYSDA